MKFIIGTRLFTYSISGFDADSASNNEPLIREHAQLAVKTLVPSLLNQTDLEFDHFTLVNRNAKKSSYKIFTDALANAGLHTSPLTMHEWSQMVHEAKNNAINGIGVARIDDDDCIFDKGVELAKKKYAKGKSIIYGWTSGLRYRIGSDCIREETVGYGRCGHHSILQTCIMDASSDMLDPYWFDHSNVRKWLSEHGYSEKEIDDMIVNGDSDTNGPAFVYVRGKNSVSTITKQKYDDDSRFKPISVSNEYLKKRFGVELPLV